MGFHEIRFPSGISRSASGGPERRTQVVTLGSGHEERNQQWADSRRRYDAGSGIKTADELHAAVAFFEERRGRAYGFRWRDWSDYKSCAPLGTPGPDDQTIGTGDGTTATFQLVKTYGGAHLPWVRTITKPVSGTVRVAVDAVEQTEGADFSVDATTGQVTFSSPPAAGLAVTAGFEFDVPVRFDTDRLDIDLAGLRHGDIARIPVIEIRV
ncbi:DUF2460 domain-containing protein [Microbaculum marinum]|uniref:DUF2460 domain-containing protein n=1 Tax=Microbaculum marinum TaxID=1764581 RepID=A0AAW9RHG7_9HYPH